MADEPPNRPIKPKRHRSLDRPRTAKERRKLLEGMPKAALTGEFEIAKMLRDERERGMPLVLDTSVAFTRRVDVALSLQRALLGEVFPALRAVTASASANLVSFRAYIDGEPHPDDLESLSCVSAEFAADFESGVYVDYEVLRVDAPARIHDSDWWIFRRREP